MKLTISEAAKLAGVSVRTLHYYDRIGLLSPDMTNSENGYRYYCEESMARLQEILFYRELDFPLKEIKRIMSDKDYDKRSALEAQRRLLLIKRQRLDRIAALLDEAVKGEEIMNFNAFDNTEYEAAREQYQAEAKERWGGTDAYKECSEKTSGYTKEMWSEVNAEADAIMQEFADCKASGAKPTDEAAQVLVGKWQAYITDKHYKCTREILCGLALMYTEDERFKANIDRFGDGTAEFMSAAILSVR